MLAEVAEVLLFTKFALAEHFSAPFTLVKGFVHPLACSVGVGDVGEVILEGLGFGFPQAFQDCVLDSDFDEAQLFAGLSC